MLGRRGLEINVKGQWRIKEFQNQGRGPSAVEFFGPEDCSNAPFQISNVFVVSVGNNMERRNCLMWSTRL